MRVRQRRSNELLGAAAGAVVAVFGVLVLLGAVACGGSAAENEAVAEAESATATPASAEAATATAESPLEGEGEIEDVDPEGYVVIQHDRIGEILEASTTRFPVRHRAELTTVNVGERVRFHLEMENDGDGTPMPVVVKLSPVS